MKQKKVKIIPLGPYSFVREFAQKYHKTGKHNCGQCEHFWQIKLSPYKEPYREGRCKLDTSLKIRKKNFVCKDLLLTNYYNDELKRKTDRES